MRPTWTLYEEQWLKPLAFAGWRRRGDYCPDVAYRRVMKRLQRRGKMQKQQRRKPLIRSAMELNASGVILTAAAAAP
ncbi:hypothetical protein F4W66_25200 (plasmid) [Escherichia coli]|nr:hypothetical protein F4W66_25200 [Escherichia coli]